MPTQSELKLTPAHTGRSLRHMTFNHTIAGTEYTELPAVGNVPLVNETSFEMFSRPLDNPAPVMKPVSFQ